MPQVFWPALRPRTCFQFVLLAAILVAFGWQQDIHVLKSIMPGWITMKFNTALVLSLLASAGWLVAKTPTSRRPRIIAESLSCVAILIAALTLAQYALHANFGIDELFFPDPEAMGTRWPPGRFAPITGINTLLIGSAILLDRSRQGSVRKLSQGLVFIAWIISFQAFMGYLLGVTYSFGSAFYTQIAVHTALLFVVLSSGLLLARPDEGFMAAVMSPSLPGWVGRRLLVSAIVFPPLVNWIQLQGIRSGLWDADFGVLLRVTGNVVFFSWIAFNTSAHLTTLEKQRRAAEQKEKEKSQKLKDSEAKLHLVADAMPSSISYVDCEQRFHYANKAFQTWFGRAADEILGRHAREVLQPYQYEQSQKFVARTLAGEVTRYDARIPDPQGKWRQVEVQHIPDLDETGTVRGCVTIAHDVTERKQNLESLERALRQLRDFKFAIEQASIITMTDERGIITHVNDRFCEISQYTREELVGTDHRIVNSGHHPKGFFEQLWRTVRKGQIWRGEVKNRAKDGSFYWVDTVVVPFLDESGKPYQHVAFRNDITQKKKIEEALRDSQERYHRALTAANIGAWEWNLKNDQLTWTEVEARLLGQEHAGANIPIEAAYRNVFPADAERVKASLQEAIRNRTPYTADFRVTHPDGSIHWVTGRGDTFYDPDGTPSRIFGINLDVSDRKDFEAKLQEALRVRDEFLSIASHELKTPLTALKLQTDLVKRMKSRLGTDAAFNAEKMEPFVNQVDRSLDRLVHLVDDMLDISRIATGKLSLRFEASDLSQTLQEALERLALFLKHSRCEVKAEIEPGIMAELDRFRLEQVITNLLTNAARYGAGAPVEVHLKRVNDGWAQLRVRDHGKGIAKEDQSRIFNRFERAISANEVSGMGLGLYIAHEIVSRHHGSIEVESELGQGAEFILNLPLRQADA